MEHQVARMEGILPSHWRARRWIAIADGVPGHGRRLFELVAEMDLEGIVAKRLADPYALGSTTWLKILNRSYSPSPPRKGGYRPCAP
jgi:ATP-dependent DNA ligase